VFPLLGLLNRMIFWELLKVFLLTVTGLTGLFLIGLVVQQASQMGLSPAQTLQAIPLLVPITLPYTIPATTLFASCVVYGRLANDNETVAMKAAGLDLLTLLRPAVLLGLVTASATMYLSYSVIPVCQQRLQQQVLEDPEEILYNMLRRERTLKHPQSPYVIAVRDVQGRRLIDVIVKRKVFTGTSNFPGGIEYDSVARAREARLVVDLDKGTVTVDSDQWVVADEKSYLETGGGKPPEMPLPEYFTGKTIKNRPAALEWPELGDRLAAHAAEREDLVRKREQFRNEAATNVDPARVPGLLAQDKHLTNQINESARMTRQIHYEQHIRPALAIGCLCFAVIGCPVGIWANRADYLSTFVTCFLPTVLTYYPLLLAGGGLAREGKVPVPLGVWAADVVVGLFALLLTFLLIRR
jgi:lipopolysaccharide export system permease protein